MRLRTVASFRAGAIPVSPVVAFGSLWVTATGARDELVRVDPRRNRVAGRLRLSGQAGRAVVTRAAVWVAVGARVVRVSPTR